MRALLFSSCLVLALAGCDTSEPNAELECIQEPISGVLQPLEVGNRWEYEVDGSALDVPNRIYEVTEKLIRFSIPGSDRFVVAVFSEDDPDDRSFTIWTNIGQGFQHVGYISGPDTVLASQVLYPSSPTLGDTFGWFNVDVTPDGPVLNRSHEFEVVDLNHTTSVPLGEFETLVFEEELHVPPNFDFAVGPFFHQFAPGIGLVARDQGFLATENGPTPDPRMQLVDYCLMQ